MKLGQLSEAAIYTSDLKAAEKFYRNVLGLEKISSMENRGISFRCGETVLLVFDPARTRIPDAGVPTHGASGEGHIAFVVADAEIDPGARDWWSAEWRSKPKSTGRKVAARSIFVIQPATSWSSRRRRSGCRRFALRSLSVTFRSFRNPPANACRSASPTERRLQRGATPHSLNSVRHRRIVAAETEGIVDRIAHLHFASHVRHVIEVALRVGLFEVDRGRDSV